MFITRAINKDLLASIVQSTFLQLGTFTSSSLLDSLKLLGFSYATAAGISINIEDLKIPREKEELLKSAEFEIQNVSQAWQQGQVSDIERFQTIIDTWNKTTEVLKNRITEYYDALDPANNLYIMAFSGARGNMSQVRQLVGMRGLMSDQEGRIIDLPIQTNFREGLTSIDYIISSYGARKGIVDTSLKTADSGYLTRRLIYIAQDLIIREIDCFSSEGLLVLLNSTSSIKGLIGRTINNIHSFSSSNSFSNYVGLSFQENFQKDLKDFFPLEINIRSILTCKSHGSICQKCYGWDLSQSKIISLGEAVGIIAAQSIGEPGTQLTMRTFHTGGIFTGEMVKEIQAPISGKLLFPKYLKRQFLRTSHGEIAIKVDQDLRLTILDWKNKTIEISIPRGSFLYMFQSCFVRQNQKIAEYSVQSLKSGKIIRKPVFTPLSGEIFFENLIVKKKVVKNNYFKYTIQDGTLWIASGKIFSFPKEIEYFFPKILKKTESFAQLKIIVPYNGIIQFFEDSIRIVTKEKIFEFQLGDILQSSVNCSLRFSPLVQNNQYVEAHTVLGVFEFYPLYESQIYSLKKKSSQFFDTFFCITEDDIWKISCDQVNNYSFYKEKKNKTYIRPTTPLNANSKFGRNGIFLKKDGFQMIFQNAICIFFPKGTILKYTQGNFVLEKRLLAKLKSYVQQTEDIVQGLPKIEELIEARKPKSKAFLIERSGVLITDPILTSNVFKNSIRSKAGNTINCIFDEKYSGIELEEEEDEEKSDRKKRKEKKKVYFAQSLFLKEQITIWENKIYRVFPIPTPFRFENGERELKCPETWITDDSQSQEYVSVNFFKKRKKVMWNRVNIPKKNNEINLQIYKAGKIFRDLKIKNFHYYLENKQKDIILETPYVNSRTNQRILFFLEYLNPIVEYLVPKEISISDSSSKFFDIGEPFTDGLVDVHDLLSILFEYHSIFDGTTKGLIRSRIKFQMILVNSIQAIYQSQGVYISTKHIEVIVRQMMTKILIRDSGDTPILPGELISLPLILEIVKTFKESNLEESHFRIPKYEPILLSATTSSLSKDGFLSAAGFQETKRVLTKAAIEGNCDWFRGLKECIILGRMIPAGSAFLNYKNYLDNVYSFQEFNENSN